jgi:hypothetical protein
MPSARARQSQPRRASANIMSFLLAMAAWCIAVPAGPGHTQHTAWDHSAQQVGARVACVLCMYMCMLPVSAGTERLAARTEQLSQHAASIAMLPEMLLTSHRVLAVDVCAQVNKFERHALVAAASSCR